MLDLPILTKEKFVVNFLVWAALVSAIWACSAWIRKAIAGMLWELYDIFIGAPP